MVAIVELVGASFTTVDNCQLGIATCGALIRNRPEVKSVVGILVTFEGNAHVFLCNLEDTYFQLLKSAMSHSTFVMTLL